MSLLHLLKHSAAAHVWSRLHLPALALAILLGFAAHEAEAQSMVSDVQVNADLTVIRDADAARQWTRLEADLETAIVERLVGRIAEEGLVILIDIDSLELANIFETQANIESSALSGDVRFQRDGLLNDTDYQLRVSASQAQVFLPAGSNVTLINPSSAEFYQAMVTSFAENVIRRLDQ
ncbi:MAG: hypothetical protein AAFQ47_06595 [Pseudomonadota bacterium]